jgi:L-threonylcarbamoyladenylate synthase
MTLIVQATAENIVLAADRLRGGGLVALPTETVYGLGADATNDRAVAAIFEAKGRPSFNPVIVHVASRAEAEKIVEFDIRARLLAELFWPGPLTLILPRRPDCNISLLCSAGLPTLAVRCPAHPVARQLIAALGRPVAAPSANASGTLSPTTPQHVVQSLGEKAGMILAGGKAQVGLESTVVDLSGPVPVLLRPGGVTLDELEMHLGEIKVETEAVDDKPKSPGQLLKHYAPKTPLRLHAVDVREGEALLAFGALKFMGMQGGGFAKQKLPPERLMNLSETGDLNEAAANVFAMLHALDASGAAAIAVMNIPDTGLGLAINDRLKRAAGAQQVRPQD